MRLLGIEHARPGMELAKAALSSGGMPLLQRGMVLTDRYIQRLQSLGLTWIYIEESLTDDIVVADMVEERMILSAAKSVKDAFDLVTDMQPGKRRLPGAHAKRLIAIVEEVVKTINSSEAISTSLVGLKALDEYAYLHAVSVAVLSTIIGIDRHLTGKQLHNLSVGAILHDVGTMSLPNELLASRGSGPLAQAAEEEYRKHVRLGFEIVCDMVEVNPTSANVVLCHHEQWDGSGYPSGTKGEDIHIFSRVISVVNVYDALTSDKPWRKAVLPHIAVHYVKSQAGKAFDPKTVDSFVRHFAPYPVGIKVRLSDGTTGVVVELNKEDMGRPVLRLLESKDGKRFPREVNMNLLECPNVGIAEVVLN